MVKYLLTMMVLIGMSHTASAFTICSKSVKHVWVANNGGVYICFEEPGGCLKWSPNQFNEEIRSMFYTQAVTALAAQKKVNVRFPENNLDCSAQPTRDDFSGIWLTNNSVAN